MISKAICPKTFMHLTIQKQIMILPYEYTLNEPQNCDSSSRIDIENVQHTLRGKKSRLEKCMDT